MKNSHEVFKETLEELGFAGYKPDQMTNSDYWLCTCVAMEKYAEQYGQALLQKAASEAKIIHFEKFTEKYTSLKYFQIGANHIVIDKESILNTKLDLI